MKRLITALACLLLASPAYAAPKPLFDPATVVKVTCTEGTGTAFRVADGKYITAAHIARLTACSIAGIPVKAGTIDNDQDVATFNGPRGGPVMPVSCDDFIPDKDYVSIGYAFGWDEQTVEPLIASPLVEEGYRAFVGEIIPGMSGGPVIGYDGKAHGINNMRWPARSMALKSTFVCRK